LALLPNSTVTLYPWDRAAWTSASAARRRQCRNPHRKSRRKRRQHDDDRRVLQEEEARRKDPIVAVAAAVPKQELRLEELLNRPSEDPQADNDDNDGTSTAAAPSAAVSIVVILIMDPYQTHSLRLLEKLVEICQYEEEDEDDERDDHVIQCLVVSQRPDAMAWSMMDEILSHSGVGWLPSVDDDDATFGTWAVTAGGVTACPSVLVVETATGRKISSSNGAAEVLAVEQCSAVRDIRTRWLRQRASAATALQHVQAAVCVVS